MLHKSDFQHGNCNSKRLTLRARYEHLSNKFDTSMVNGSTQISLGKEIHTELLNGPAAPLWQSAFVVHNDHSHVGGVWPHWHHYKCWWLLCLYLISFISFSHDFHRPYQYTGNLQYHWSFLPHGMHLNWFAASKEGQTSWVFSILVTSKRVMSIKRLTFPKI